MQGPGFLPGSFLVLRGLPVAGAGHASLRSHLAPRSPSASRGSASPSLCTLGRFAGRPWRPPSLLRQVLRVRCGRPLRGLCIYMAYGRSLVRNSPRGWTPRSLTTIRLSARRAGAGCVVGPGSARNTRAKRTRFLVSRCPTPSSRFSRRACRRCRRALWLDPREPHGPGESSVPTLEASSAQVSGRRPYKTRREAAFRTERGGPV